MLFLGFFGVFSPSGELEAVETSEDMAKYSAINLGPTPKTGKTNRTVRPVIVIGGMEVVLDGMIAAAHKDYETRKAAVAKAEKEATTFTEHGPVMAAGNDVLEKRALAKSSHRLLGALMETKANGS